MNNQNTIYKVDERAFFLDCGRKYFSPKWFEKLIPTLTAQGDGSLLFALRIFPLH